MKKILVTGGCGFIGSNFIRHILANTKRRILNLDKLTYSGNPDNLKDVRNNQRYFFVRGDICDRGLVSRLMGECDTLVNFAAESHVDRSIKYPAEFIRTNVMGTQVLLEEAKSRGIERFIHISTDEVYGSVPKGYSNEMAAPMPNSPYAASKAAADLVARAYHVTYKTPVIITRSSNNFGPYQYPEKVIPLFVSNALDNKHLPLYGDGLNRRDWMYVEDNCSAIAFVMRKGVPGEIYNIGGAAELTNIRLAKMIIKILGKSERLIKRVKDRPGHDRRYALDSRKLYKLGWRPAGGSFRHKLEATIGWYKDNREWWTRLKKKKEKFW